MRTDHAIDTIAAPPAPRGPWRTLALAVAMAAVIAGVAACATATPTPGMPIRLDGVEVGYRDPARLTERVRYPGEPADWLDELSRYIATEAARRLPSGERLSVTITDVQLAGMFERWRPGDAANFRIVRDTTPPRIDLSFRLESAQGATLKEGERHLHDVAFMTRTMRHRGESLSYEKNLIDAWLRQEFAPRSP